MARSVPLLFLDTSVVIASILSPTGGSRAIFDLAAAGLVRLVLAEEVAMEANHVLQEKYGDVELTKLYQLLLTMESSIRPTPASRYLARFDYVIIDPKDRHILAGAMIYQADYLITLDKKHFITAKLKSAKLPFASMTPELFFLACRRAH